MFEIYREEKHELMRQSKIAAEKSQIKSMIKSYSQNALVNTTFEELKLVHEDTVNALIDLYLGVKIRKNDEIMNYNNDLLKNERDELLQENHSAITLIDYIKNSIEILINLKNEEYANKKCLNCDL